MDRYKNEYEAWLAKRKKLLRICPDDVNQQLAVLPEPKRPLEPIIICDEPTIEGVAAPVLSRTSLTGVIFR